MLAAPFARPTDTERWLFFPNKLLALSKGRRQDVSHARAAQKLHYGGHLHKLKLKPAVT